MTSTQIPPTDVKNYLGVIVASRIASAVFWSVIFQCCIVSSLRMVFSTDIVLWQPVSWMYNMFYTSLYLVPLGVIILTHAMIWSETITTLKKSCNYSRFSIFLSFFSVNNLFLCIMRTCSGGLFFWLFTHLMGLASQQGHFSSKCNDDTELDCLIEINLYILLCGFWIGFSLFLKDYVTMSKVLLEFPMIQQRKCRQVMNNLFPTLKQSCYNAFTQSIGFVVVYYMVGNIFKDLICGGFLNIKFEDGSLSSAMRFSNAYWFLYSWLISSLFLFTLYSLELLLKVFMMYHISFPIMTPFGSENGITLHHILSVSGIPITNHIGHLDLMLLAARDRKRREDLFSLSQPGGHPYNWNAILSNCLDLLNTFTADLNLAYKDEYQKVVPEVQKPVKETFMSPLPTQVINSTKPGLRNLSMMNVENLDIRPTPCSQTIGSHVINPMEKDLVKTMKAQTLKLKERLFKNHIVMYIFGDLPEVRQQHIFHSKGQLVIWTAESLSLLASASFEEDSYGVVQKDLAAIIIALLELKQSLEKLQKAGSYKKPQRNEKFDNKIKFAVRSAVRRSIYRISVKFGHYLKELPLSSDALQQLHSFLIFKEG